MMNDEKGRMSKGKKLLTRILIPPLKCGFIIPVLILVSSASATVIQVEHHYVTEGDVFLAPIDCFPNASIKGWEFKIRYDPSFLFLQDIIEGDFFGGYLTFPVMRENATYDLIVGQGNVSDPGVLAFFEFRALRPGKTNISIYDAGVCDETGYLPVTLYPGNVSVTKLRVETTIRTGWNRFAGGSLAIQGYSTFGSDVMLSHGWSTFQSTQKRQTDFWNVMVTISAVAIVITIAFMRRFKKI